MGLGLKPQSIPKKLREMDHSQRGNSDTIPALLGPGLTVPKAWHGGSWTLPHQVALVVEVGSF